MLLCEKYSIWPLNDCTYGLICAVYLALFAPVNVGSILWHSITRISRFNYAGRRHSALRSGTLPVLYFLVLLCHVVLVLLPLGFLATNFHDVAENPLKAVLFIALYLQFWIAALVRFVGNRHYHEQPLSLVVAYAGAGVLVLLPLFSWSHVFPSYGPSSPSHRAYFITAGILVLTILLTVLSKGTLKRESDSTWANFASKLALIFPYIWPKKSVRLQLQVLICLLLLALGRIINIALPLYSKWIVDELAGPHRFCYDLILISTGLKFLQGSGAMGGFLNTLRSFFWIRIQQYTTLEIEVDLFAHLHSLSLKWHLSRKTGQVLRIMDRGTNSINSLLRYETLPL
ncbi:ABC6 protein [Aphelenchoides avenae]|nr:ABC6 protein [Aphelenchus avenae]